MYKHFVLTQFNLKNFPLGVEARKDWIKWTRKRIDLFYRYCLPSFLNQSNKNFSWLLYFDSETPDEFHVNIEELKKIDFVNVRFANGFDHFMEKYTFDIEDLCKGTDWVMISRCDNDDCLEKDAIAAIQSKFVPKDEFMISLASGYILNTANDTLSHYYYPESPFITIIESCKKEHLKGIFYCEHRNWPQLEMKLLDELFARNVRSVFILDKPYWMQVVHGENVSNSAIRGFPVLYNKLLTSYGIQKRTKRGSFLLIPAYKKKYYWKRYLMSILIRILKR